MLLGIKRIYEKASITDGKRILVDRLWPRGVRKSTSNIDSWMKDVAPSEKLRKWFSHDKKKWATFKKRYDAELKSNPAFKSLIEKIKKEDITLVYAAQDERYNNAQALAMELKKYLPKNMKVEHKSSVIEDPKDRITMLLEKHGEVGI